MNSFAPPRRIYLEVTSACNLGCVTCMRQVWNEPLGQISARTFEHFISSLTEFSTVPNVFLGGYGEPLSHPGILKMIKRLKNAGAWVELITNGVLLTPKIASALISTGLDRLWVSVDGATSESYTHVRQANLLPQIMENIHSFQQTASQSSDHRTEMGIAFVAMQNNIADLPLLVNTAIDLEIRRISITNVLAHTPELQQQRLYRRSQYNADCSLSVPEGFPLMDETPLVKTVLEQIRPNLDRIVFQNEEAPLSRNRCPFNHRRSLSVSWNGAVSPCLPLLHTHQYYLDDRLRINKTFSFNSLDKTSLAEIWDSPSRRALQHRLDDFDFSPCVVCNTCHMSLQNQEDCFGNEAPACGGCLWAQSLIQCP